MNREAAITILRNHEPELRTIGVVSASVFRSVARGEAGQDSDVDVPCDWLITFPAVASTTLAGWKNSKDGCLHCWAARST